MTDHEAVAKVLLDAANLVERKGWVQGQGTDGVGHCMMHALGVSIGDAGNTAGLLGACMRQFRDLLGVQQIAEWNDAPGRTKQEVLDALQSAAKAELRLADGADS